MAVTLEISRNQQCLTGEKVEYLLNGKKCLSSKIITHNVCGDLKTDSGYVKYVL